MEEILQQLPQISPEVTVALQQLSTGRGPGVDGISVDFYKTFRGLIGKEFFEALQ